MPYQPMYICILQIVHNIFYNTTQCCVNTFKQTGGEKYDGIVFSDIGVQDRLELVL